MVSKTLFACVLASSVASGALGQGFFPGQGASSDDYDPVTVPLSDLDDSGCPVTTGIGGVRILLSTHRFLSSSYHNFRG